jgi:hypothetical protein
LTQGNPTFLKFSTTQKEYMTESGYPGLKDKQDEK